MSRIGVTPISIPNNVTVTTEDNTVIVKGGKDELSHQIPKGIQLAQNDGEVTITRANNQPQVRANHGMFRSVLSNMVQGVTDGFTKKLELVGTGYRAKLQGNTLILNVGYSNPVEYKMPDGITTNLEGDTVIALSGIDKQQVGQVAAEIRSIRKPEPYKGKGIRYQGEVIRKKAGKSTKVGASG